MSRHWSFDLLGELKTLAWTAGAATMEVYNSDFVVKDKDDKSPVTEADKRAEAIILARLAELTPDIPIVAEESVAAGRIPEIGDGPFWLVDPVDGTKEFIKKNGEFTVNIGLIENAMPVCGVVYAPALDALYAGAGPGTGELQRDCGISPLKTRTPSRDGVIVVGSRSHGNQDLLDDYLGRTKVISMRSAGSSLKFCLVASGEADVYPRHGPTMEWDTAAGHAVLLSAGGAVNTFDGKPLRYGKPEFRNPYFVALGQPDFRPLK